MAPAALHFASRLPNRVVFRVARAAKTLGFCMSADGVWIAAEVAGFEHFGAMVVASTKWLYRQNWRGSLEPVWVLRLCERMLARSEKIAIE